jgi:uncharacterized membrane protein YphA (DoxX/SURF4 family)
MRFLLAVCVSFLLAAPAVQAHVGYIVPLADPVWSDRALLPVKSVLDSVIVWILILVAGAGVLLRRPIAKMMAPKWKQVVERVRTYEMHVPWILRLSLGIALIGAGSAGEALVPTVAAVPWVGSLEVVVGFCLLAGFLLTPSAFLVAVLWVVCVVREPYVLGNLELFAAAVGLLLLADPKPGIDHLLGIPFFSPLRRMASFLPLVLRVGLGGAMLYLAVYEKFLHSMASAVVADTYDLTQVIPVSVSAWVYGAGLVEALIGIGFIVGRYVRPLAALAFVVLTLSFFYFGEEVYAHVTLFGVLSCVFILGDRKQTN